jgi:preprotein translocase subunit SecG
MYTAIAILHILVCLFLIMVVLLQKGRGSDIGAVFGGGSAQTLFGSAGPGTFLSRLTVAVAAIFMFTSILMAGNFFAKPAKQVMEQPEAASGLPQTQNEQPPAVPEKAPEKP